MYWSLRKISLFVFFTYQQTCKENDIICCGVVCWYGVILAYCSFSLSELANRIVFVVPTSRPKISTFGTFAEKHFLAIFFTNTVVSNSIKISRNFKLLYIRNGFQIRIPGPKYACAENFKYIRQRERPLWLKRISTVKSFLISNLLSMASFSLKNFTQKIICD